MLSCWRRITTIRLLECAASSSKALSLITLPMPSGRAAIRQRGVYDYLVKPVSREMLAKVLATVSALTCAPS